LYKPNSRNYASTAALLAMAWSSVAGCRVIFLSAANTSGQFGTGAEMSWVQSVLGPKCLDTSPI